MLRAKDPGNGAFSFKLGRADDSVSSEPGEPEVDGVSTDDIEDVAQDIVEPSRRKEPKRKEPVDTDTGGVGRKKRK